MRRDRATYPNKIPCKGMRAGGAQDAENKLRMVTSLWNVLDFLAIFPPVVELVLLHGANVPFTLGRLDLRWFKILRRVFCTGCQRGRSPCSVFADML